MFLKKCLLFLLSLSSLTHAAGAAFHDGKVTEIGSFPKTYGSYSEQAEGLLAIYIDGLPPGCGSGIGRVVIGVDHPIYNSVLAIALYAKASGSTVTVSYFEECTLRGNSWDLAYLQVI